MDFREIFKFYVLPAGDVFPVGDLDALTYKEQSFGLLEEKPLAPPKDFGDCTRINNQLVFFTYLRIHVNFSTSNQSFIYRHQLLVIIFW